jgi:hypothetical protein
VPFTDIYDAPLVANSRVNLKLDAAVLKANDIVLLEFVVRRYFPDRKVRSAWGVTFDLMRMFRMLSAPDDAPVEPNSGDKRSAIVIDDD